MNPIRLVWAGTALTVGCAAREPAIAPETPVPAPPPPAPEPAPALDTPPPATPTLPTWDEVASTHPKGATNPPMPVLVVTPDGACYKDWVSPMMPGVRGDRVDPCDDPSTCGTPIVCPPDRVAKLLGSAPK